MRLVVFALAGTACVVGCQEPGKVVHTEQSPDCPSCSTETVTGPIEGWVVERHLCPTCHTEEVSTPDENIEEWHHCARCKAYVIECGDCAKKTKRY